MELSEFDIQYKPHPAIKSQVLADFIAKCTIPDEGTPAPQETIEDEVTSLGRPWILYINGSSTPSTSRVGIILASLDGEVIEYAF